MADGYSILVDTSKCTACRGCQIACKQWNQLPGTKTRNAGSYENPLDLSFDTYKVVRFAEGTNADGKLCWNFFSEQCRHCLSPGCMAESEKDEIIQDEKTGAVLFTPKTKDLDYKATLEGCPYNIPRQDPKTKVLAKCTMCFDRISNDMVPACVKSCPTGGMTFGERDKILDMAKKRVEDLKKSCPKAMAINPDDVRVIYIVADDPRNVLQTRGREIEDSAGGVPMEYRMTETKSPEQESERIRIALKRIREEMPPSANLIDAFEELLAEQAAFKAELSTFYPEISQAEFFQFSPGRPILGQGAFSAPQDYLKQAVTRLVPAMKRGFPGLSEQLSIIERFAEDPNLESAGSINGKALSDQHSVAEIATALSVDPEILQFVILQLLKPFAGKKAESVAPLISQYTWQRGYCPVCGSWPQIGFVEGPDGRRWLKCSACGHEWTFSRTQCPFCESIGSEKLEMIYSEDRPFERAELCHACMKYLVSIDLRTRDQEILREVAALGLVYLDILAQERGFSPGSALGWNEPENH